MDACGVDVQILSPMPELLSYWFDVAPTEILCESVNATIAELVALAPNRFRGLGMVPLQQPDRAASALHAVRHKFGLSGVEIGSNINGIELGDRRFDPFYAAAEELDLAIFVHALHPVAMRDTTMPPVATALVGFPIDTAMAASSLIYSGTLQRFPRLRFGFSHGGGALGPILHRMQHGWSISGGFDGSMAVSPREQAAQFYYDSLVYDPDYMRHLAERIAPGHIFVGTDYPYALMQQEPGAFLAACRFDTAVAESIAYRAASEFIRL